MARQRQNGSNGRKSTQVDTISASSIVSSPVPTVSDSVLLDPALDIATLRALESILTSRSSFIDRSSISAFEGTLDFFHVLGYPRELTNQHYRALYERSGLAERFVRLLPEMVWVNDIFIEEIEDVDELTQFEADINGLFEEKKLWTELLLADIGRRLTRYAVLLIGIDDGLDLDKPANATVSLDQILYFTPYDEERAQVSSKVGPRKDMDKEEALRIGLPEFYNIKVSDTQTLRVHHSRIIHIVDPTDLLDNRYESSPVLRSVYNDFIGLYRVDDGGCLQQWRSATRNVNYDIDPEIFKAPETGYGKIAKAWSDKINSLVQNNKDQLEEAERNLRPYAVTSGITPHTIQASVPTFSSNAEYKIKKIASKQGLPWRMFFGAEAGDLASSQDRQMVTDRVNEYINKVAKPNARLIVDWLLAHNTVKLTRSDTYDVQWPATDQLNQDELSTILVRIADANQKQVLSGAQPFYTTDEVRNDFLEKEPVDIDDGLDLLPDDIANELEDLDPGLRAAASSSTSSDGSSEPEWKAIHRVADDHSTQLQAWLDKLWTNTRKLVDINRLTRAIDTRNNLDAEQHLLSCLEQAASKLKPELETLYVNCQGGAGEVLYKSARAKGGFGQTKRNLSGGEHATVSRALLFKMQFNKDNPRALSYAADKSSTLIVELIDEQLAASRELIFRGIEKGIAPKRLQQEIRKSIGLRSDQLRAIDNLTTEMLTAEPGTLITRFPPREGVRQLAGFRAKVPKGSIEVRRQWAAKQSARYTRMQENLRARTIGRSEMLRSANQGQRELWQQAVEQGQLSASAKRIWIDTGDEREREEHRAMAGQVVGLDEPFLLPDGSPIEPGEETNCRCCAGITE